MNKLSLAQLEHMLRSKMSSASVISSKRGSGWERNLKLNSEYTVTCSVKFKLDSWKNNSVEFLTSYLYTDGMHWLENKIWVLKAEWQCQSIFLEINLKLKNVNRLRTHNFFFIIMVDWQRFMKHLALANHFRFRLNDFQFFSIFWDFLFCKKN